MTQILFGTADYVGNNFIIVYFPNQLLQGQGLGIAAGANFADRKEIDVGNARATFHNSTGYHVGIEFEVGSGALALRPGIFYQRLGTYDFPTGEKFDLSAVEVPVDIRLTVLRLPVLRPYRGPAGPLPRLVAARIAS